MNQNQFCMCVDAFAGVIGEASGWVRAAGGWLGVLVESVLEIRLTHA